MAAKTNSAAFDPSKVREARQLIFPTMKIEPGVEHFITIKAAIEQGKSIESKKEQTRGPAMIMRVLDLQDPDAGEKQIVCNKLLVGTLKEGYPNDGYVGKSFRVTKSVDKKKGESGEYYTFAISEIEYDG